VRRIRIAKAHGVDVVIMSLNPKDAFAAFNVIDIDRVVSGSGHNLSPVARKPN
jgi:hypothetical protein